MSAATRDPSPPTRWRVVVPVKGGPAAKSRLRVPHGVDRIDLATALALDTVAAAAAAVGQDAVTVVTSDARVTAGLEGLGVEAVADPAAGLNAAVTLGLNAVRPGEAAAVLLGDVPALRPEELSAALALARTHLVALVPDAEGTGSVLLTGRPGVALIPRFGLGSAAAHEAHGAVRLELDLPGLRRDVDDEESLRAALRLGVGRHTAALLAHLISPAG
jgi:2-phospho-L-lactate guanylyltransferase